MERRKVEGATVNGKRWRVKFNPYVRLRAQFVSHFDNNFNKLQHEEAAGRLLANNCCELDTLSLSEQITFSNCRYVRNPTALIAFYLSCSVTFL